MDTQGTLFNIQHFSLHDGPGIRTIVFMKGCPLRCQWCHNPESRLPGPQLLYHADKCTGCRACEVACAQGVHRFAGGHSLQRAGCTLCGRCALACPSGALGLAGYTMSVSEALQEVLRDKVFYESSGGGLTLSGGEPFYQGEFATALLRVAKAEGLHTCVETSGACSAATLRAALPHLDLVLFDIKELDDPLHRQWTGASNQSILENLRIVDESRTELHLRCPIIPGCNDREAHYNAVARLANTLKSVTRIELLMYHPFGIAKSQALGEASAYTNPDFMPREAGEAVAAQMRGHTAVPIIVS